jgi:hypothetical protein
MIPLILFWELVKVGEQSLLCIFFDAQVFPFGDTSDYIPRSLSSSSFIPHDMMYGPQAALIAECFTPRLRYSGASYGFHMASIIAGGPAPLIATALLARFGSGYAVALYILFCALVSIVSTSFLPDYTNRDISAEHDDV